MQGFVLKAVLTNVRLLCLILIISALATNPIYAQTGVATITGVVTDQSDASVPGVSVTALHTTTGQVTTATTSDAGVYVINALPVGDYTVTVIAPGFKTKSESGVVLTAEQSATINFKLAVGAQAETVSVESNGAVLETETSSLGETVSETEIEQLPLNGRNPGSLVTLTAGVVPGTGSGFTTGVGLTNPNNTVVAANGGRAGSVYFLLDGANNVDNRNGFANPFPNPDATQEFSVISNNPGAQYGFAAGGVVSIVTKSGTNQWHGDGFEFVRNYGLDAANWFSHLTDTLVRNQYGGSIGGPILRNKIFIFGNYQRTQETSSITGTPAYVPNTAELNGNWSQLLTGTTANLCGSGGPSNLTFDTGQLFQLGTSTNYVCPTGTGQAGQTVQVKKPYAGNLINPSVYSPLALNIEQNLPQTSAANNLTYVPGINSSDSTNEFTIRGDYILSDKQRLYGRVFYQKYNLPNEPGNGDFLAAHAPWITPYTNYAAGWIYAISSKMVNNATFSYSTTTTLDLPLLTDKSGKPASLTTLGMNVPYPNGVPDSIEGFGVNSYFSFPSAGFSDDISAKTISVSDQLSLNKGKHLIVAGVDVLHYDFSIAADWLALPLVGFTGQTTGNAAADFLTGSLDSFTMGGGTYGADQITSWAPYVQDTYHLKPNLTINVGVRWEPYFPATISAGRIPVFVPGQQSTRYPNAPLGMVFPGDKGISDTGGIPNSPWLFSPRVGFAYQPKSLPNTSIRGSFGIFTSPFDNSYYQSLGESAPFSPTYTFTYNANGTIPFADPWSVSAGTGGVSPFPPFSSATYAPPATVPIVTPTGIQTSFSTNFQAGRDQTWNLSVEQKMAADILLTVAYVGSQTYHLPLYNDLNPGIYASLGQRTTYPNFNSILQYQSRGDASFNALEVRVEKRLSRGLTFTSNYTFSKALDTVTGGDAAYNGPIGDPFDVKWNYGISDLNRTNNWVTSFVYQTPSLGQYGHLAKGTLGNWQTSGIFTLQSGAPFSVQPSGSCPNGGNPSYSDEGGDRADVVPGQTFGEMLGSKSHWINQYFNPGAFTCNAIGTFGDSGRNLLTGPRYNNWDLGFGKNIPIRERFTLQFRWEMFNAMNTPHFSNPGSSVGGAGYGVITSLASSPRIMQGAAKVTW